VKNNFLVSFSLENNKCISQVLHVIPLLLMMLLVQVMKKYVHQDDIMIFQCMVVVCNSNDFFNSHKMEKKGGWGSLDYWCSRSPYYNVTNQASIIQEFN
jgi:hypothetical protein